MGERPHPALRRRADRARPAGRQVSAGFSHLGIGCETREEVERRCELARGEGRTVLGPHDSGPPVGYWAFITDPDGNNLELSHGQEVGLTVEQAPPG